MFALGSHFSWVLFEHLALIFKYWQVQGASVSRLLQGAVVMSKGRVALLGVGIMGAGVSLSFCHSALLLTSADATQRATAGDGFP